MLTDVTPVQVQNPSLDKASPRFVFIVWLVAIFIGISLAMTRMPSVFVDGAVSPLGNDAFYHAARILEVAEDPSSTHSFDPNLHWPEGHWIIWPWAYDYLGGVIAGTLSSDRSSAAQIMVFYPLLWLIGSITLVGLIAREVLRPGLAAICMFAYAAKPLTVTFFCVGALDHHSAEHFWLLVSVYLAGMWLKFPKSTRIPVALGMVLAVATAFHNILFLLQIPVLAGLFIARLSGHSLPTTRQAILFGASLLLTQVLVLLPSHYFVTFEYAFYLHSWFHVHVALLTAIGVFAICSRQDKVMWLLLSMAVLLALPTAMQVMFGMRYLQSDLHMFDVLRETQSLFGGSLSIRQLNYFFTLLVWLIPVCAGYAVYQLSKRHVQGMLLMIMVASLFGFALYLAQIRFSYFGYFFLVLIPLLMIQQFLPKGRDMFIASALFLGAFTPSLSYYLIPPSPGDSPRYTYGLPLIQSAQLQCESQPGLLLADNDWGSYLRYSTQCPLLSNNFIITQKEVAYVKLTSKLLQQTPEQLRIMAPDIRYILVSAMDLNPLSSSLLGDNVFEGFKVVEEMRNLKGETTGRLYRVEPAFRAPLIMDHTES